MKIAFEEIHPQKIADLENKNKEPQRALQFDFKDIERISDGLVWSKGENRMFEVQLYSVKHI